MDIVKRSFIPLLVTLLVLSACTPKAYPSKKDEHFTVKSTFTQTEVPGQQNAKSKDYLHIVIDPNPENYVLFDSVLFDGKIFIMNSLKGVWKLDRSKGNISSEQYKMKGNEALLFYSINGKGYKYTLDNIESKQPIYLP